MKRVIVVSGPTGGHFFPAVAIGERLRKSSFNVKFYVPERKYIKLWLERKQIEYTVIPEIKFKLKDITFPFKLFYGILYCLLKIKRENPHIIIGTGSYVIFSPVVAGKILKKKVLLHEQNYIPGKATRILSFFSDKIALTFPYKNGLPEKKCIITGFPVMEDFRKKFLKEEILKEFGLENRKTVLVMGGSQGAEFINRLVEKNIEFFSRKNFQFIHLAGREKEKVEKVYKKAGVKAKVFDFFYDMGKIYSAVDMAITRAGAGTIAEIVFHQIPPFLIPYPFAGGHQKKNAFYLSERKACFLMEQKEENVRKFPLFFEKFLEKNTEIRENLKKVDITDSGERIYVIILSMLKEGESERKI